MRRQASGCSAFSVLILLSVVVLMLTAVQGKAQSPASQSSTLFESLSFCDLSHGWVVGENGTIWATSDGGENWKLQVSGTSTPLLGVNCVDAAHAWAVGVGKTGGVILATSNDRENWTEQRSDTSGILLTSVQFLDSRRGWVAGDKGAIWATTDGGENWQL
jgi:photosystem II stability/assembly factor-like uncharacterized protein